MNQSQRAESLFSCHSVNLLTSTWLYSILIEVGAVEKNAKSNLVAGFNSILEKKRPFPTFNNSSQAYELQRLVVKFIVFFAIM